MLLIGNALLEYGLPLALQLPEQIEHKLIEVLDRKFRVLPQGSSLMLHYILSIHIQLMDLGPAEVVCEPRLLLFAIELVLGGVLAGRDKDDSLIQS